MHERGDGRDGREGKGGEGVRGGCGGGEAGGDRSGRLCPVTLFGGRATPRRRHESGQSVALVFEVWEEGKIEKSFVVSASCMAVAEKKASLLLIRVALRMSRLCAHCIRKKVVLACCEDALSFCSCG